MKLLDARDKAEAKHKLRAQKQNVHGKLNNALELIILYTKESQEDAKDLKFKVKECLNEMATIDREIKQ